MTYSSPKTLTFDEFITHFADNPSYELIDGELRDMESSGPHEIVTGKLTGQIFIEIVRSQLPWVIHKNCLIKPPASQATALRPDIIILDEEKLKNEPLWSREPIITLGDTIKLVVEVVSTNWQDDYARKIEEYAILGITEYWIVDYLGLGGIAFIGKPKQPTFTVAILEEDQYHRQLYRLGEQICSRFFPNLLLCLDDILPR